MSTKVAAKPAVVPADRGMSQPAVRGADVSGVRAAASAMAPAVAALAALAVHFWLPDWQTYSDGRPAPVAWMDQLPFWVRPYSAALEAVLAVALLLTASQWAWPPLRRWVRHNAPLLAGAVVAFGAWDLFTLKLGWLGLPYYPGPHAVLGGMVEHRDLLLTSAWCSLLLLLSGYAAGVAAGLVSGVLIGWFPRARYWGMPILKVVGPLPATALVPIVMTLSSVSFVSASALIAFAVWFPVTMLTVSGIANVRLSYLDVARTLGAGRLYLIFRVAIPAALPNIFVGMFMGLGASFLTLIVAETVGRPAGLGWYLKWRKDAMDYAHVYASLLIMAVFFSMLMTLLFAVRDRVLKWQKGVIKW